VTLSFSYTTAPALMAAVLCVINIITLMATFKVRNLITHAALVRL
jgi:hypothetical protein